jgi:CsoR family transcriptional regulator, copper-sensing transcriptional repressor
MVNQAIKKRALHRAKILRGQLDGLIAAIDREEYCVKLLGYSRSIDRSLTSLDTLLLENHLRTHVKKQLKKRGEVEKAIKELLAVYGFSKK